MYTEEARRAYRECRLKDSIAVHEKAVFSVCEAIDYICFSAACEGMPNTNNKIEGTFTDLKKNLNNHGGMTEENRKRFICGFFLALIKPLA